MANTKKQQISIQALENIANGEIVEDFDNKKNITNEDIAYRKPTTQASVLRRYYAKVAANAHGTGVFKGGLIVHTKEQRKAFALKSGQTEKEFAAVVAAEVDTAELEKARVKAKIKVQKEADAKAKAKKANPKAYAKIEDPQTKTDADNNNGADDTEADIATAAALLAYQNSFTLVGQIPNLKKYTMFRLVFVRLRSVYNYVRVFFKVSKKVNVAKNLNHAMRIDKGIKAANKITNRNLRNFTKGFLALKWVPWLFNIASLSYLIEGLFVVGSVFSYALFTEETPEELKLMKGKGKARRRLERLVIGFRNANVYKNIWNAVVWLFANAAFIWSIWATGGLVLFANAFGFGFDYFVEYREWLRIDNNHRENESYFAKKIASRETTKLRYENFIQDEKKLRGKIKDAIDILTSDSPDKDKKFRALIKLIQKYIDLIKNYNGDKIFNGNEHKKHRVLSLDKFNLKILEDYLQTLEKSDANGALDLNVPYLSDALLKGIEEEYKGIQNDIIGFKDLLADEIANKKIDRFWFIFKEAVLGGVMCAAMILLFCFPGTIPVGALVACAVVGFGLGSLPHVKVFVEWVGGKIANKLNIKVSNPFTILNNKIENLFRKKKELNIGATLDSNSRLFSSSYTAIKHGLVDPLIKSDRGSVVDFPTQPHSEEDNQGLNKSPIVIDLGEEHIVSASKESKEEAPVVKDTEVVNQQAYVQESSEVIVQEVGQGDNKVVVNGISEPQQKEINASKSDNRGTMTPPTQTKFSHVIKRSAPWDIQEIPKKENGLVNSDGGSPLKKGSSFNDKFLLGSSPLRRIESTSNVESFSKSFEEPQVFRRTLVVSN